MTHVLHLYWTILIKEYILHPNHPFVPSVKTSKSSLTALPAHVLQSLQNLETRFNQEVFTKTGLFVLVRAIKVKQWEIVRLAYDINAIIRKRSHRYLLLPQLIIICCPIASKRYLRLLFLRDLVVNDPTNVPVATHTLRVLGHDFVHVLTSQVVFVDFATTDGLLAVGWLLLVVEVVALLAGGLPWLVSLDAHSPESILLLVIVLHVHLAVVGTTKIWRVIKILLPVLLSLQQVVVGGINVILIGNVIGSASIAQVEVLNVHYVDVTEVVLALVQLFLDLPVLLIFLFLIDQVLILELEGTNLVI